MQKSQFGPSAKEIALEDRLKAIESQINDIRNVIFQLMHVINQQAQSIGYENLPFVGLDPLPEEKTTN